MLTLAQRVIVIYQDMARYHSAEAHYFMSKLDDFDFAYRRYAKEKATQHQHQAAKYFRHIETVRNGNSPNLHI
jgi:hypothetical protein